VHRSRTRRRRDQSGSAAPQSEQRPTSNIDSSSSSFLPVVITGAGNDVVADGASVTV